MLNILGTFKIWKAKHKLDFINFIFLLEIVARKFFFKIKIRFDQQATTIWMYGSLKVNMKANMIKSINHSE